MSMKPDKYMVIDCIFILGLIILCLAVVLNNG